jgi:hypothetical protein
MHARTRPGTSRSYWLALVLASACAEPAAELERPATFVREHLSDRGFERVRETENLGNVSVLRIETNYYGGASGGVMFGWMSLSELCTERGFDSFVILEHHPVRYGNKETAPGTDWEVTVGLLHAGTPDLAAEFPGRVSPASDLRVWPKLDPDGPKNFTSFVTGVMGSDLWDVFSSIHFAFRDPAAGPSPSSGTPPEATGPR